MFIARRSYEVIILAYFGQCDLEKQRGGPNRCGNTGNYLVPLHSASTVVRMQSILAKLDYLGTCYICQKRHLIVIMYLHPKSHNLENILLI